MKALIIVILEWAPAVLIWVGVYIDLRALKKTEKILDDVTAIPMSQSPDPVSPSAAQVQAVKLIDAECEELRQFYISKGWDYSNAVQFLKRHLIAQHFDKVGRSETHGKYVVRRPRAPGEFQTIEIKLEVAEAENGRLQAEIETFKKECDIRPLALSIGELGGAYERARDENARLSAALAEKEEKWNKQYALTCTYIHDCCELHDSLGKLVDAVNVEFPGGMSDIGGKTGPALIDACNKLAAHSNAAKTLNQFKELQKQLASQQEALSAAEDALERFEKLHRVLNGKDGTFYWRCHCCDAGDFKHTKDCVLGTALTKVRAAIGKAV